MPDPLHPAHDPLAGVHPALCTRVRWVLAALEVLGHTMVVTAGLRTEAEQQALYAKGRTLPGPIVTHADGVRVRSNHQAQPDGFGYAVDCAFVRDGQPSWAEDHPWRCYGEAGKAAGLVWGGDWTRLVDRPHLELPPQFLEM